MIVYLVMKDVHDEAPDDVEGVYSTEKLANEKLISLRNGPESWAEFYAVGHEVDK